MRLAIDTIGEEEGVGTTLLHAEEDQVHGVLIRLHAVRDLQFN